MQDTLTFDEIKSRYYQWAKKGYLNNKINNSGVTDMDSDTILLNVGGYYVLFGRQQWDSSKAVTVFTGFKREATYIGKMIFIAEIFRFLQCTQDMDYGNSSCNNMYTTSGMNKFIADEITSSIKSLITP